MLLSVPTVQLGSSASWYEEDGVTWDYRKKVSLNGTENYNASYPTMRFILKRETGTDANWTIYMGTGGKADYTDIRVTEDDGTTKLAHYIQGNYTVSTAILWFMYNGTIYNGTTTDVYFYWGNDNAIDVADGLHTFVSFGDFEDVERGEYHEDWSDLTYWGWTLRSDIEYYRGDRQNIEEHPTLGDGTQNLNAFWAKDVYSASAPHQEPSLINNVNRNNSHYGGATYLADLYIDFEIYFVSESHVSYFFCYESAPTKIHIESWWDQSSGYYQMYYGGSWHNMNPWDDHKWYYYHFYIKDDGAYDIDLTANYTWYDADWKDNPDEGVQTHYWKTWENFNGQFYIDNIFVYKAWLEPFGYPVYGTQEGVPPEDEGIPFGLNLTHLDSWLASALSINVFIAGLLLGLMVLMACMLPLLFTSKERPIWATIIGFAVSCFNVAIGWFPVWELVILVLIVALMFSDKITKKVSGG